MAVQYENSLKDTRMTAVITAIDAGSAAGTIEICTAAYGTVLCVLTLSKPSFTEANQMITMAGVPKSGTAGTGGTAANARIKDSNGNVIVNGLTVGAGSGDVSLNSVVIAANQTVTLNSGTITHG
jgi:hypothetical protein